MKVTETLTVLVDGEPHGGVSALGIGHLHKDLVLVRPEVHDSDGQLLLEESSQELGNTWTKVVIVRESGPAQEEI